MTDTTSPLELEPDTSADQTAVAQDAVETPKQRGKREKLAKKHAEMRQKALEGRIAGMTWRQAAAHAGYADGGAAYRAAQRELAAIPRESAKELREIELERLDMGTIAIWKNYRLGDPQAVSSMAKLMDHRAKLLGLYNVQPEDNTADVAASLTAFLADAIALNDAADKTQDATSAMIEAADHPDDDEDGFSAMPVPA